MMIFSESEKEIIRQLIDIKNLDKNRALNKYIFDDTHYIALEWDKAKVDFYFIKEPDDSLLLETWDSLCETLFLFKRLESNNLIGTYSIKGVDNTKYTSNNALYDHHKYEKRSGIYFNKSHGKGLVDLKPKFFNSDIGKYLDKYAHSYVYVSQSLKELVKNDFRTEEQIRHSQILKITYVAIGLSLFIGIASIVISNDNPNIDVLNSINRNNLEISNKLESINSNIFTIKPDTIN